MIFVDADGASRAKRAACRDIRVTLDMTIISFLRHTPIRGRRPQAFSPPKSARRKALMRQARRLSRNAFRTRDKCPSQWTLISRTGHFQKRCD